MLQIDPSRGEGAEPWYGPSKVESLKSTNLGDLIYVYVSDNL